MATSATSSSTPGRSGDCARALTAASTAASALMATSSSALGSPLGLPRLLLRLAGLLLYDASGKSRKVVVSVR